MLPAALRAFRVVLAAALLGLPLAGAASPGLVAPPNADVQRILDAQIANNAGTGIVVGILDHGKTSIFTAGSSGTPRPLDEHSLFEIGSVTKTFTATILADMVAHHEVSLDEPVEQLLPSGMHVPARNGKAITLLLLATQHSGLPREAGNLLPYTDYTWSDLTAFLNTYSLTRDPGAAFEYSNLGVSILGDALADAAHTSFAALVQTRILTPLGMSETSALPVSELAASLRERIVVGHGPDGTAAPPLQPGIFAPAGGIRSSVSDMLRFVRCNLGQGPLAADCLFSQQPRDTFPGNRIGLIWWTGDVVPIVRHAGDTLGFHAGVAISPDHQRGVVVLTSGSDAAMAIAEHLIDAALPVPQPPPSLTLAPAALNAYVGTYHNPETGNRNRIRLDAAGLTMQVDGTPGTLRIYALGGDRFLRKVLPARLAFTRDPSGAIDAVTVRFNGGSVAYVRDGKTPPEAIAPTPRPSVALDANVLAQYAGTYLLAADAAFTVATGGESGLTIQATGWPALALYASAKDHFFVEGVDAQLDFTRNAAGNVTALTTDRDGRALTAIRR